MVPDLQVGDLVCSYLYEAGGSGKPSAEEHQRMMREGQAELVRLREALTVAGGGIGCLKCKEGGHRWGAALSASGHADMRIACSLQCLVAAPAA